MWCMTVLLGYIDELDSYAPNQLQVPLTVPLQVSKLYARNVVHSNVVIMHSH